MEEKFYKQPIKVVCVNTGNSIKLIKGAVYTANRLYTVYGEKRVSLKGLSSFKADLFKTVEGELLINFENFKIEKQKSLNLENDYTGKYVKCIYGGGKSLKENEVYFIEKHRKIQNHRSWGNNYLEHDFKIRGMRNYCSTYHFVDLSVSEQRKYKLQEIKGESFIKGHDKRKFLHYTEQEKIIHLFEILAKTLIDIKNTELNSEFDVVKLIVTRGKKYAITEDDAKDFLKHNFKTLLKKLNLKF